MPGFRRIGQLLFFEIEALHTRLHPQAPQKVLGSFNHLFLRTGCHRFQQRAPIHYLRRRNQKIAVYDPFTT